MEPDKIAAYERNIAAAEEAMKSASVRGDADAYSRALFTYKWAKRGHDNARDVTPRNAEGQIVTPRNAGKKEC